MADTLQLLALQPPKQSFFDSQGRSLVGGQVWTYVPGTTTPKTTYADSAGTNANPNPTPISGFGTTQMFGTGNYDVAVYDRLGTLLYTQPSITVPGTVLEVGAARDQTLTAAQKAIDAAAAALKSANDALAYAQQAAGTPAGQLRTDLATAAAGKGSELVSGQRSARPNAGPRTLGDLLDRNPLIAFNDATLAERMDLLSAAPTMDHTDLVKYVLNRAATEGRDVDWRLHGRLNKALYRVSANLQWICPGTGHVGPATFQYVGATELPVFAQFGQTRHDFYKLTFDANRNCGHAGMGHSEDYFTRCLFTGSISHGFAGYVPGATNDALYINATGSAPANIGTIADLLVFTDCLFTSNGYAWRSTNAAEWNKSIILSLTNGQTAVTFAANSPVTPDLTTMIKPGDSLFRPAVNLDGTQRLNAAGVATISGLVAAVTATTITLANPYGGTTQNATLQGIAVGHSQPGFDYLNGPNNAALFGGVTVSGTAGQNVLTLSQPIPFSVRKYWDGGTICRFNGEVGRILGATAGADDSARVTDTTITLQDPLKSTFSGVNLAVYHGSAIKPKRSQDNGRWDIRGGFWRGNAGGCIDANGLYGVTYAGGGQFDGNGWSVSVGLAGGAVIESTFGNVYTESCAVGYDYLWGAALPAVHQGFVASDLVRREYIFTSPCQIVGRLNGIPTYSGNTYAILNVNQPTPNTAANMSLWVDASLRHRLGQKVDDDSGINLSPMVASASLPGIAAGADYSVDVFFFIGRVFSAASAAELAKYTVVPAINKATAETGSMLVIEAQNFRRNGATAQAIVTLRVRNVSNSTSGAASACAWLTNAK